MRRSAVALLLAILAAGTACAGPRSASQPRPAAAAALDPGLPLERAPRGPSDPWPALARALRARRLLDGGAEVEALLAAAGAAPAGPLATLAMRRLAELGEESPARAAQVDAGVARLLAGGLREVTAFRARVTRALAAEAQGDQATAARFRAENGAVSSWTVTGPWSELRALDFDRPVPPEDGSVPDRAPAPAGLPAYPTRTLPAPDGTFALEGEPPGGDVYALVSDAALSRGGRYLLAVSTTASVRVEVDGAPVHERRAFAAWLPSVSYLPMELGPGRHRLVVKIARTDGTGSLSVSLARADGAPSDVAWSGPPPGDPPPPSPAPTAGAPLAIPAELVRALEPEVGPTLARLLVARDVMGTDRETAKALLSEAMAAAPGSASLLVAAAAARIDDPTLDHRIAQTRAEAALRDALKADPGQAEARIMLARLLMATERLDDADLVLAALEAPAASSPAALATRARCAEERGLSERAEELASLAATGGRSCDAADLALALASRRQALSRAHDDLQLVASCRGGQERLARELARQGDARGAGAALGPYLRARPWDVDAALAYGETLIADGAPEAAARRLVTLSELWPRSARVALALASALELQGDRAGARAARERALLLDGADLDLRRALALEDGREVVDELALDAQAAIRAYERSPHKNGTSAVMVLDAAEVDIHPGAVATERTQQVIHVLDQAGVEQHGEVSLPAGAEVIALRTIKPDGRILEPERGDEGKGSISLSGLEPGDYVQVDYVRSVRSPFGTLGYAADTFYFSAPRERLVRSIYVVRAPAGAGLEAESHGGMPAPVISPEGGAAVMRAEVRDAVPFVPEPESPAMVELLPSVDAGVGQGREAFQRGVADRLLGRAIPTLEIRALARQIRAEAADPRPAGLVRAAYARVAKTVLGEGAPLEDASEALSRGRGSRLLVLQAVLEALGIEARVALIRPFGVDPAPHRFATAALYPSQLLRVRAGGETLWLDPSSRMSPFGAIPDALTGCEALVLPAPGEPLLVDRTPARSPVPEGKESALRIVLAPDGTAELSGSDRYTGALAAAIKGQLEPLDASQRRQAVEGMLSRMFQGMSLTEVAFEGEDSPDAALAIRWRGQSQRLARPVEGGLVIEPGPVPAQLAPRYLHLAARATPLLLHGADRSRTRVEIVAPPGLRVVAEPPARLETPFGSYQRTDRAEGSGLVREEELIIERGRIAPERYRDFSAFVAEVDGQREAPVRITR